MFTSSAQVLEGKLMLMIYVRSLVEADTAAVVNMIAYASRILSAVFGFGQFGATNPAGQADGNSLSARAAIMAIAFAARSRPERENPKRVPGALNP